jgi:hypothetical protein
MPLADYYDMVKAFPPQRANHLSFAKTSSHLVDNGRRSRDRRGNARRLQTTARERAAWAHPDPLQKEEELGVGRQSSRTEGRAY